MALQGPAGKPKSSCASFTAAASWDPRRLQALPEFWTEEVRPPPTRTRAVPTEPAKPGRPYLSGCAPPVVPAQDPAASSDPPGLIMGLSSAPGRSGRPDARTRVPCRPRLSQRASQVTLPSLGSSGRPLSLRGLARTHSPRAARAPLRSDLRPGSASPLPLPREAAVPPRTSPTDSRRRRRQLSRSADSAVPPLPLRSLPTGGLQDEGRCST